jgi:hypothetical protein
MPPSPKTYSRPLISQGYDPFLNANDEIHSSMRRLVWWGFWVLIGFAVASVLYDATGHPQAAERAFGIFGHLINVLIPSQVVQKAIEKFSGRQSPPDVSPDQLGDRQYQENYQRSN